MLVSNESTIRPDESGRAGQDSAEGDKTGMDGLNDDD
jgi:hypothetical protein